MQTCYYLRFWVFFICCFCNVACSTLQPWERGNLAKPHMALDPNPLYSSLTGHNYSSREGAAGGSHAEGGGCGCY
jgi:Domain of unknown function (DUF4266)